MGGNVSQLPLADSSSSVLSRKTRRLSNRTASPNSTQTPESSIRSHQQTLASREHALFTAVRRTRSAKGIVDSQSSFSHARTVSTGSRSQIGQTDHLPSSASGSVGLRRHVSFAEPNTVFRSELPFGHDVKEELISQVRSDVRQELGRRYENTGRDHRHLVLALDNATVRHVIQEILACNQPLSEATPRLIGILTKQRETSRPDAVLHLRNPDSHDHAIIAMNMLSITHQAGEQPEKAVLSRVLDKVESAFVEDTAGVDLVVDFSLLAATGLLSHGAKLARTLISESARHRGNCRRVFFVEFPEELRAHCTRWRNELPRDFRRRIWCIDAENVQHVLPDYLPYYQAYQNGNSPSTECHSGDSSPPVWPTADRATLSPAPDDTTQKQLPQTLSSYLESNSRQLCFKQLAGSNVVYEAFFSMTNINPDSILVARLSPRSSAYQLAPSKLTLLPYMQNKDARIYTTNDIPTLNDLFRLQVYVLGVEQSQRFMAAFDAMDEKAFMGELRRATLIKFGCNLFVGGVVGADGDYLAACRSQTSQCAEVNEEWAGEGDMLDWTVDSPFPVVNEPYCDPSDESLPKRRPKITVSGFVQTETVVSPPPRQTIHGHMQTEEELKKEARSYLTQTEQRATSLAQAQTDPASSHYIPPPDLKPVSSGSMQTDQEQQKLYASVYLQTSVRETASGFAQVEFPQIPSILRPVISGTMQTDSVEPRQMRESIVQAGEPKAAASGHMQTENIEPKQMRDSMDQGEILRPVASGHMQTDAVEIPEPKSMRESMAQTNPPEPLVLTAVTHGFVQTTPTDVGHEQIQTDRLEVPVVTEGYMQTEVIQDALRPVASGMMQTETVELILETKETYSHNIQTETRAVISGYMQTDPGETTPRLVLSAFMQTDVDIIPKETASEELQTDPVPTAAGYIQTDQIMTQLADTQTVPRPSADAAIGGKLYETKSDSFQTNVIETKMDTTQTDAMKKESPPVEELETQTELTKTVSGLAQTEPKGERFSVTQTDAPPAQVTAVAPVEVETHVEEQLTVAEDAPVASRERTDWRRWAKLLALLMLLFLGFLMGFREGPFVDVMDWTGLGTGTSDTVRFVGKAAEVPGMTTEKNAWIEGIKRKARVDTEVPSGTSKGWFSWFGGWWWKETPWQQPKAGDPLDDWKGEMPGTLPARRGLERTLPDLGLTKEWLHTLALRFDGSTSSWNSLRSANDVGCRNEWNAKKKRCRDEYWGANKYVSCRIANSYDHNVWGI